MAIVRVRQSLYYTVIPDQTLRDTRLTLDTHGLLHWLLSMPDGWEVRPAYIQRVWGIGRDRCRRLLRELETTQYLVRRQMRGPNGHYEWISEVWPVPRDTMDGSSGHGGLTEPERMQVPDSPSTGHRSSAMAGLSGARSSGARQSGHLGITDRCMTDPPSSSGTDRKPVRGDAIEHPNGGDDGAVITQPSSSPSDTTGGRPRPRANHDNGAGENEPVADEGELIVEAMAQQLRAGGSIHNPAAFAASVLRSVVRHRHVTREEAQQHVATAQQRVDAGQAAEQPIQSRDRRRRELESEIDELARDIHRRRELATLGGDPDGAHAAGIKRARQRLKAARSELGTLKDGQKGP